MEKCNDVVPVPEGEYVFTEPRLNNLYHIICPIYQLMTEKDTTYDD